MKSSQNSTIQRNKKMPSQIHNFTPIKKISKYLVFAILAFTSCRKQILTKVEEGIIPNEVEYSKVAISAKTKFQIPKQNISLKSSLRMQKDSVFWCSVSVPVLGEAARVLILSDSAKLLAKLPKKEYYAYSLTEFSKKYGLSISPFILQDVLVGNRIIRKEVDVPQKLRKEKKEWILEQYTDGITITNYIPIDKLKIQKVVIENDTSAAKMTINYSDFEQVQERVVPKNIQIELLENKNEPDKSLNLEFSISRIDFEVEEQSYPFKVTSKYERKQ